MSEAEGLLSGLRSRRMIKWRAYAGTDVIPAWVADMDLAVAPLVREAMGRAIAASDLGYPPEEHASGLADVFAARAERRWGWKPDPSLTHSLPYVARGLVNAVEAFTLPGDRVVVQTPIYPPFLSIAADLGRIVVPSPFGDPLPQEGARIVMLCNPHNPLGRAMTREELIEIAEWAERHDAVIVSDEIHGDLVYTPNRHIPIASLGDDVAARTVTLVAASKAFNLAGMRCAIAASGSRALHERLMALGPYTRDGVSTLGIVATEAAWSLEGDEWLDGTIALLQRNRDWLCEQLANRLPVIRSTPPEATYLAWLDCRGLGLDDPTRHFLERAGVALSNGRGFGPEGEGHVRLNFATYPAVLAEIVDRMEASLTL
ncbi:MAG: MalY/PatB family protein [Acidimicrobiia bacterium]